MPSPSLSTTTRRNLITTARRATSNAYAPYSGFKVGAAVLTSGGGIFAGCNVENASYGLCNCAERTAIFTAIAAGESSIVAVAIHTPTSTPTAPCGACRQVINEFGPESWVISVCDAPEVLEAPLSQLLPNAFGPASLTSDPKPALKPRAPRRIASA